MKAERFPIDFDELKKGDYIPEDVIRVGMDLPPNADYKTLQLAQLQFKFYLEKELVRRYKVPWVVKCEKMGLRVLTDEEAVPYTEAGYYSGKKKMVRHHALGRGVDQSAISTATQQRLDTIQRRQARELAALHEAERRLRLEERRRQIKDDEQPEEPND